MPIRERHGRFQVVVEHLKGPGGQRRQRTVGTFPTRQEAEAAEQQARNAYRTGGACYLPLQRVVEHWWFPRLDASHLRPSTIRHYKGRLTHHVLPVLGDVPLARLDGRELDQLLTWLLFEEKLEAGTVDNVRSSLRRFLRDAREEGLIVENIAAKLWTPAEVERYKQQIYASERRHAV